MLNIKEMYIDCWVSDVTRYFTDFFLQVFIHSFGKSRAIMQCCALKPIIYEGKDPPSFIAVDLSY